MTCSQQRAKIRHMIALIGAGVCLLISLFGLCMITYWHDVTGSWMDEHIFFWQLIGLVCIGGVFVFTQIVGYDI
jgi:hypothetical protein